MVENVDNRPYKYNVVLGINGSDGTNVTLHFLCNTLHDVVQKLLKYPDCENFVIHTNFGEPVDEYCIKN